jgi:hypothetical protein
MAKVGDFVGHHQMMPGIDRDLHGFKPDFFQVQLLNKCFDGPDGIVFDNVVIKTRRLQTALCSGRLFNESLHPLPQQMLYG